MDIWTLNKRVISGGQQTPSFLQSHATEHSQQRKPNIYKTFSANDLNAGASSGRQLALEDTGKPRAEQEQVIDSSAHGCQLN